MKDIIIFGIGKYFEHKKSVLEKYNVKYILDNKVQKGKNEIFENTGILLINPLDLDKDTTEEIYLMSMHFVSMWKQLVEIGIEPSRIVHPYFEKPYFQSDNVLAEYADEICFSENEIEIRNKNGEVNYVSTEEEWKSYLRRLYRIRFPLVNAVAQMGKEPISMQFATERGTPIDRIYIESFLSEHRNQIVGDVLEIEDNFYTLKYGGVNVKNSIVMDVSSKDPGIDFNANIETGEGIRENVADCFILTQTLMYIYDLKTAAKNIGKLLKHGGVALITCSGISQNSKRCMDNYGCYFNFNEAVFEKMFTDENVEVIETGSYGNVKTVSAHIVGMCYEDLDAEDFIPNDKYYPLIVYAVVKKNG